MSRTTIMVVFLIWRVLVAEKKTSDDKGRQLKKSAPTVRDKATKAQTAKPKGRTLKKTVGTAAKPIKAAANVGKKKYFIPMPDNRFGRFLNKERRVIPTYFRGAWQELKLVNWPNRKETVKLTTAVIVFAFVFGLLIAAVDFGLDKVFKELLLK